MGVVISSSAKFLAVLEVGRQSDGALRRELIAAAYHASLAAPVLLVLDRVSPAEVDKVLAEIPRFKPFQGNDFFDNVGYGEWVYVPVITTLLSPASNTKPDDIE